MYHTTKHLPPPENGSRAYKPRKYPFTTMAVGESFFVPTVKAKPISVRVAASKANRRLKAEGKRFRCAEAHSGIRVWRVT